MRDHPERNAHEGHRTCSADGDMEMTWDPGRVVNDVVELPASEHDAAGATEDEGQHRKHLSGNARITPRKGSEPSDPAAPPSQTPGIFQAQAKAERGD